MESARSRKAAPAFDELQNRMLELRPHISSIPSVRGSGVALRDGKPPAIFVDLAFPRNEDIKRLHEMLRDDPHVLMDVTRQDAHKEV
jgi:hypothetical protein